ncbi:MAG: hypothetical protein BGN86_16080 [Caulobacterales bacterium 68-7]|nr:tyrosine-protein phosphatase [Caulobacterales bacterium]OJU12254.1 MAG: hypothetical protein BGN86_16080 [Caulobacterales bacterium 68-7]
MDRRVFLTAIGGALAFDTAAFAAAPVEAAAARTSPDKVKIDWKGGTGPATIFVASNAYASTRALRRVGAAPRAGSVEIPATAAPRPYFLVQTRGGDVWTAERLLPLQGGRNFRDLGGYRSADGRQVRWGRLYRSGVMSGLTDGDRAYLSALGINTICDLRNPDERRQDPSALLKSPGVKINAFDYDMSSSLAEMARAQTRDQAIAGFAASYMNFIETLTPHYTDMFGHLVRGEVPLAVNCSAGKDRTGVASALILSVLGVPRDTIVADYALTQVYTPPANYTSAIANGQSSPGLTPQMAEALRRLPPEVLGVLMGSPPEVMRQTLAQIDAKYGGPVELAKAKFGLTDGKIAQIRSLYLV